MPPCPECEVWRRGRWPRRLPHPSSSLLPDEVAVAVGRLLEVTGDLVVAAVELAADRGERLELVVAEVADGLALIGRELVEVEASGLQDVQIGHGVRLLVVF